MMVPGPCAGQRVRSPTRAMGCPSISVVDENGDPLITMNGEPVTTLPPLLSPSPTTMNTRAILALLCC